jgi:predicted amidohydrolase YtcJ
MLESDPQLRGRFIMLDRVDVHCIWVSEAVLRLLPDEIEDVPGGESIRDPGMGVFCDNAMDIVLRMWPRPGKSKRAEFLQTAMRELHKVGLVGMHDAGVFPEDLALLAEVAQTEEWSLRVYAMVECAERNTFCPEHARKMSEDRGMLSVRSVKLFAGKALMIFSQACF